LRSLGLHETAPQTSGRSDGNTVDEFEAAKKAGRRAEGGALTRRSGEMTSCSGAIRPPNGSLRCGRDGARKTMGAYQGGARILSRKRGAVFGLFDGRQLLVAAQRHASPISGRWLVGPFKRLVDDDRPCGEGRVFLPAFFHARVRDCWGPPRGRGGWWGIKLAKWVLPPGGLMGIGRRMVMGPMHPGFQGREDFAGEKFARGQFHFTAFCSNQLLRCYDATGRANGRREGAAQLPRLPQNRGHL